MKLDQFKHIYLLGIGGIGMSALARYFKLNGFTVSGYDRTNTHITESLQKEGVDVSFIDKGKDIGALLPKKENVLVIYTPALPTGHKELSYFKTNEYTLKKRAEVLGIVTQELSCLAVAGTHGKTTTSTMLAHLMESSGEKCNAFLGGISANYNTNLLVNKDSPWVVVEADEFDRSFLHLHPMASILTSVEADHLDIYKTHQSLITAFEEYVKLIPENGLLIHHHTINITGKCKKTTYGVTEKEVDFQGKNLRYKNGSFLMDIKTPKSFWEAVKLGVPGIHNAENALSVVAMGEFIGFDETTIRKGLASFKGVKRRFEYIIKNKNIIYIDDYAHHPTAIKNLIQSIRLIYPKKSVTGIFQPHLYSRTSDFMNEFATELSLLDEVILLPIYPAREKPIRGINSETLLEKITCKKKSICHPNEVAGYLSQRKTGVFITIGAGDIDRIVEPLKRTFS